MFAKYLNQYKTSANLNLRNSDNIFITLGEMSKDKKTYSEVDKFKIMKNLVANFSDIQNNYLSLMFLISIQESESELKKVIINGDFLEKFKTIDDRNINSQLENFFLGLNDNVLNSLTKEQIELVLSYYETVKREYGYSTRHDGYKAKTINFNEFDLFIKLNKLNSEYNAANHELIKSIVKTLSEKEGEVRSIYFNLINNVIDEADKLYKSLMEEYNAIKSEKEENNSEDNSLEIDLLKSDAEIAVESILNKYNVLEFFLKPLLFSSNNIAKEKIEILVKLSETIIRKGKLADYKKNFQKAIDLVDILKSSSMIDKIESISTERYFDNIKLFESLDLRINSETVKHFFIENEGWADRIYNKNVENTIKSLEDKNLSPSKFGLFKNLTLKNFNKKAFLNLIQSTPGDYLENINHKEGNLLATSVVEHINLNTLNKDTLKTCLETVVSSQLFNDFAKKYDLKVITAQELFFIVDLLHLPYGIKKLKEELYFHFIDEKLDERLRLMKALPSHLNYISAQSTIEMFDVKNVLEQMKLKSLNELKGYVSNKHLSKETNLILFLFKEELPILKEVEKDNNLAFIINNYNLLKEDSSLKDLQNDFIANSSEVETFKKLLSVKDQAFFDKYFDNLLNFYNNGLVKNSLTYINSLENRSYHKQQVENFKLLVKAELAGKLQEVKFDKMDLMKELIMNKIDDELAEKWFKNTRTKEGRFTIKESSDFKTLFEMGEKPINSCMSYNRGSYNHCLLSIFDSNKKLVTVYDGETLVGRAIVRFTKIKKGSINENGLGFKDIEDEINDVNDGNTIVDENEMKDLGIFIERLYTGYDSSQRAIMCDAIVKLMKEKAEDLGVKLYLSASYDYKGEAERHSDINVFISHSKNGSQYIDSLGGSQDAMSGGRYVKGRVYEIKLNNELVLN